MNRNVRRWGPAALQAALLVSSTMLTSCSPGAIGEADRDTRAEEQQVARLETEARSPMPPAAPSRFHFDDTPIIPGESAPPQHGQPLPTTLGTRDYAYPKAPMSLSQIARIITDDTHIPVVLAPEMVGLAVSGGGAAVSASPTAISPEQARQALSQIGAGGGAAMPQITPITDTASTYVLNNSGSLASILDGVTSHFNCTWVYDGSQIVITKYLTRTYSIHAIASNTTVSNSMSGTGMNSGGGSGGSGGGSSSTGQTSTSSQNVSSTFATDSWTDIVNGVKGIVGGTGLTDQQGAGTITVTAEPSTLERVQEFIDRENEILSNLVTISIEIVNLDVNVSDQDTFNPDLILKSLGTNYSLGLYAASSIASAAGAATSGTSDGNTTSGSTGSTPSPGVNILHGSSSALITALSTLGRTKVVYRHPVTTMNGAVAPFSRTTTTAYVANVSVTNTGSSTSGSQTSAAITTGTVVTGLNIALVPKIDERNRTVMIEEAISESSLAGPDNGFRDFTSPSGDASVQLPIVNATSDIAYFEAPSGDTIVLSGYSADTTAVQKNGSVTPENILFGGSQSGSHVRSMTFYLITPVIERISHKTITTSGL